MRYVYSVIHFVPDPVRGEFVNVGVIAGSDESSEWDVRAIENLRRARSIDDKGLLPLVWGVIDDVGRQMDLYNDAVQSNFSVNEEYDQELSEQWLRALAEESRNVIQFSSPSVILADTVDEALDTLFAEFIVEPESRQFAFKKKHVALAAVRHAYRKAGLKLQEHFEEGVNVSGQHHNERFDFIVANGSAVQLAQTWSFQISNQKDLIEQVKAWAWTVKDVRKHGGEAATKTRRLKVPRDIDIEVVYVPPSGDGPRGALEEALAAFKEIDVKSRVSDQAEPVGHRASELIVLPRD